MIDPANTIDEMVRRQVAEAVEPYAKRIAALEARDAASVVEMPQPLVAILSAMKGKPVKPSATRMVEIRDREKGGTLLSLVAGKRGATRLYFPSAVVRYFGKKAG